MVAHTNTSRNNLVRGLAMVQKTARAKGVPAESLEVILDLGGSKPNIGYGESPCLISIGGLSEYSQHHHTVDILAQQHHMMDSTRGWSWPPNKFTQRYSPGSISNLPRRFEALRRCCSAPPEMRKRPGGPRRMVPRLPPGTIAEFGGLPPQSVRSYLS